MSNTVVGVVILVLAPTLLHALSQALGSLETLLVKFALSPRLSTSLLVALLVVHMSLYLVPTSLDPLLPISALGDPPQPLFSA